MANDAETTARNAENDSTNDPGYCLQQCRIWAGIDALYPDAATAWRNTNDRHPGDRNPPRGSAVYWTGGSSGYGHICISLGGGQVRSTDAGGSGKVATKPLGWFESAWGLPYAGWAWDINEATIRHGAGDDGKDDGEDDSDMPLSDEDLERIAKRVNAVLGDYDAEGKQQDKGDPKHPDRGDERLRQIENVVRQIAEKVGVKG